MPNISRITQLIHQKRIKCQQDIQQKTDSSYKFDNQSHSGVNRRGHPVHIQQSRSQNNQQIKRHFASDNAMTDLFPTLK